MTRPIHSILRGASALALAVSLAAPAHAAAPDAAPIQPGVGGPDPVQLIPPPKQLRLRMVLQVHATTDMFEGGGVGNTEDEIYYAIAGMRVIGTQLRPFDKTVRPSGSKDIWEMGFQTNEKLRRVLFAGQLGFKDVVAMNLAIGEQDNSELKSFVAVALLLGETLGQMVTPGLDLAGLSNPAKQDVMVKLVDQTTKVMKIIGDSKDQIPGSVAISINKHKLKVSAPGGAASIIEQDSNSAKIKLTGDKSHYTLTLSLEPTSSPNPPHQEFLDSSEDDCGEPKIKIPQIEGASVVVKKGEKKAARIPDPRYRWYCGNDGDWSEEWATAPGGTNLALAKRSSSGDTIKWRWFREKVPAPDLGP